MSGNLLASSLLASHAPVNREPHVPQSEARGQGAGFESLLAEFDPPNAKVSAARGDNGPAPHAGRAALSSDPSALGTARATLGANIDAALSSLAKGASLVPAPTSSSAAAGTAAPAAPSTDARAPTTSGPALPTEVDAALSALATVASGASGQAASTARAASSAEPRAPTPSRATLITDIDAAVSSPATGPSPTPAPTSPIAAAETAAAVPSAWTLSRAAPATNQDASLSSLAVGASRAPGQTSPVVGSKTAATAARAAPSAAPSGPTKSHALVATNGETGSLATSASFAPESAPIAAATTSARAARSAPAAHPSAPTPSHAASTANVGATPSALPIAAPIPASGTSSTAAPSIASSAASIVASVKPSTTSARQTADAKDTLVPVRAGAATIEADPVETTPSAATAFASVPTSSESETASPYVASWPSGSRAISSLSDAGALTAGLSATPTLVSGGAGLPTETAKDMAPTPGAAPGAISYATQIALSFAPELGFQGLQTKTHLAVQSAASASGAVRRGSPQAEAAPAAFPLSTPSAAPAAQANPSGERSSSANPGRDDSAAAAPRAEAAKALGATSTMVAGLSTSLAASSSTDANAVNLSDLGDRLASEARSLAKFDTSANAGVAAVPIKELHLDLQPANLGAVAVRLKMTGGKLSVDVGVANPNALAAVESQRDTIVSKLQAGTQPLESFVVHQQAFAAPFSSQITSNPSLTGSSGNTSGHDQSSRDAREQTPRQPRAATTDDAQPARDGLRTGLVV